jgi:hypothetical protein
MAVFTPDKPVDTDQPTIEVTISAANTLGIGPHRFRLVVTDDSGNVSDPAFVDVIVRSTEKPTAVLDAPQTVNFGQSFTLTGSRSHENPPGKIVKFEWTLLSRVNPATPVIGPGGPA